MRAENRRRVRSLRQANHGQCDRLRYRHGGYLGSLAPQLEQERAYFAQMRVCAAFARSQCKSAVVIDIGRLAVMMAMVSIVVMMMVIVAMLMTVIVMKMRIAMNRTLNDVEPMVEPGVGHKNVQPLAQQRNGAVQGEDGDAQTLARISQHLFGGRTDCVADHDSQIRRHGSLYGWK